MAKKRRILRLGILEDEVGKVCLITIPWTFWLTWTETCRFFEIIKEKRLSAIIPEPRMLKSEVTNESIWRYVLDQYYPLFKYSREDWMHLNGRKSIIQIKRFEGGPKELAQD